MNVCVHITGRYVPMQLENEGAIATDSAMHTLKLQKTSTAPCISISSSSVNVPLLSVS